MEGRSENISRSGVPFKERGRSIGGQLTIDPAPGGGSRLEITLPVAGA